MPLAKFEFYETTCRLTKDTWRYSAVCASTGEVFSVVVGKDPLAFGRLKKSPHKQAEQYFGQLRDARNFAASKSLSERKKETTVSHHIHPSITETAADRLVGLLPELGARYPGRSQPQYLIWNESDESLRTRVCHDTFAAAEKEATRLAKRYPGNNFVILRKAAVVRSEMPPAPTARIRYFAGQEVELST